MNYLAHNFNPIYKQHGKRQSTVNRLLQQGTTQQMSLNSVKREQSSKWYHTQMMPRVKHRQLPFLSLAMKIQIFKEECVCLKTA